MIKRSYEKLKREMRVFALIVVMAILLVISFEGIVTAVNPSGANYTGENTTTMPSVDPQGIPAQAGNVTEVNIVGVTATQSWQGYYGNVSGTIQLADSGSKVLYNWSVASPEGEVYASTNDSIQWGYIHCFNFTATGTFADDSLNIGDTSLYGLNLTTLEANFNINSSDVDGVDETFNLIGGGTHDRFYTSNNLFDEGECRNTRIFSSAGKGEDGKFEEVLLYDSDTRSVIFTSILEEDVFGFNSKSYDFEMLVLEDGHETDTSATTYYFYVELQ